MRSTKVALFRREACGQLGQVAWYGSPHLTWVTSRGVV